MRWISLLCFLFMVLSSFGQEQTLYWIGGAGNWDDISHWSFQSGSQSAELPSSIPTSTTHVVFDAASGFTGTGNVASRKVIVRTNGNVYKSLTFMPDLNATNSPIITNINDYSMRVLGNVTLQAYVWIDFVNNGAFIIDVPINETYNLILNGIPQTGKLSRFSKIGDGKLVVDGILGGQTIGASAGILEYLGSQFNNCTLSSSGSAHVLMPNVAQLTTVTLTSNGNSEILLPITTQLNNVKLGANGNSQILLPICTTILGGNSSLTLNNTTLIDLPLCESFTGYSISLAHSSKLNFSSCSSISLGSDFGYSSNVALNLNGLENLYINTMHGNGNNLLMPNLLIANAGSWNYIGGLTAGVAEFIVRNGRFDTKEGTVVNKVTIKNPKNSICYLSGFNSTINHLIFENSGAAFNNSMNFGNLNLAAGVTYNFISTGTYNISESINLNVPDCTSYTKFITSSEAQATIKNNTSSAIQLVNLMSENINYSGSNLINITGVDNGFNSGNVIFSEPIAKTIYWVGDANDNQWNNITNWALQSGGIGGTCIPSPFDTVIFDENSVILNQNLIISNGDAYVHNLIIEADAPVFNIINQGAVTNSIFCYGSWTMRSGISVRAITRFVSKDLSETITSNSSTFDIVVFRGLGGWVLQDDFQIRNNGSFHLYLRGGILDTNGKNVFIGGNFIGNETGINNFFTRTLLLRSSTISVNNQWLFNFTGNILDAGTSHLILREGVTFVSNNGHEYYNITKNGYNNMNFNSVLKANIIKCYNSNLTFNGNLITNELRFYSNTISWLYLNESSTIQSTLEIPKSSFLLVGNNRTLTLNGDLISNTPDCVALSTIAPTSLLPTDRFFLKSANDIFIPNVWMLGVHADTSTGASYTATGFDDENNQNFTFTDQTAKDLYWIGTENSDWFNGNNWTLNSNGTPSGGCVPTKYDNVHFNSFSGNGLGGLNINSTGTRVFFNNFITHDDAPANLRFQSQNTWAVYGNFMSFGNGMSISILGLNSYGVGTIEFVGPLTTSASINILNLHGVHSNQIWNVSNLIHISNSLTTHTNGTLNLLGNEYTINTLTINDGVFNASNILNATTINFNSGQFNIPNTLNSQIINFNKGVFNAENTTINVVQNFVSNNNNVRVLNIKNAVITNRDRWSYAGSNATLLAEGSKIFTGGNFTGGNQHQYNNIETTAYNSSLFYIGGTFFVNDLTLAHNRTINNSLKVGNFTLLPKNVFLTLAQNTTLTVTDNLVLNGTPCLMNRVLGIGSGANINYANPNNNNKYDFVQVQSINATNATLEFEVNSSNLGGNNANVIFKQGVTGVVGLGDNNFCQPSYFILAYGFYGGPLSTYKWFKKNESGVFVQLDVPLTTLSIDTRNYGLDGEYRVEMVYDSTLPIGQRCEQVDTVFISFKPEIVQFTDNELNYCEGLIKTLEDISLNQYTLDFIQSSGAVLEWFDAPSNGNLLPATTVLENGIYYASLSALNGCVSDERSPITIIFNQVPMANAGPNQIDPNQTQFVMQANNPTVGVGTWSVVSGNVSIADVNSYNTTVTLLSGESATLRWTVNNNGCISSDVVKIGKSISGNHVPRVNPSLRMRVY